MYDIYTTIQEWLTAQKPVVIATVISTWGSAPRSVGAKMAFTATGDIAGSVSGGCVEGQVIVSGLETLKDRVPKVLDFHVSNETAFDVGLACGGEISILVSPLDPELFSVIKSYLKARRCLSLITILEGPGNLVGLNLAFDDKGLVFGNPEQLQLDPLHTLLLEGFQKGIPITCSITHPEAGQLKLFIDYLLPPPSLVIIGGVHIAVALASLANILGYETTLIDPRKAFANRTRFPHIDNLFPLWPDEAFKQISITPNTCIAVLTHDPKIDDPALKIALKSEAFYIGALGSKRTHENRRARLLAEGISAAELERLHAPIGLDLGAKTPEEIALAIMAEIVAVWRKQKEK